MHLAKRFISYNCILFILSCAGEPPPSDGELRLFYKKNQSNLEEVVRLCENNMAINEVDVRDNKVTYYPIERTKEKTEEVVARIREIIMPLNTLSISCDRIKIEKYKFRGASFILYASGLTIAGELKGINYSTPFDLNTINSPFYQEMVDNGEVKKINDSGWFIYHLKY